MAPIGFLVIDKPAGITSHDVVTRIRKRFDTPKVGHLGTLDPMATGVLPIAIGKATRLVRFVSGSPKEYAGRIRLGQDTSTCDADGDPAGEPRPVEVTGKQVAEAMASFLGNLQQVPPAYSAKKISGVRAHRLARRGVDVRMTPVEVFVETFEILGWTSPELHFRAVCSPGTYIRSLARDLGSMLGTGGHLRSLRRIRSGPFRIEDAAGPDQAEPADILPPEHVLSDLPRIEVDDAGAEFIRHGRPVDIGMQEHREGAQICIFNSKERLIAVGTRNEGWANPEVVLM